MFRELYPIAQEHYRGAFREEVRESGWDVRSYVRDTANGEYSENGKDAFVYQVVSVLTGRRSGYHFLSASTGDVLSPIPIIGRNGQPILQAPDAEYGVYVAAYGWTAKRQRGKGYGKQAFRDAVASAQNFAESQGYIVKLTMAELERVGADAMRALQSILQMAVPVVMRGDRMKIAYYEQPGLEAGAAPVPLTPAFGVAADGMIGTIYWTAEVGGNSLTLTEMPTEVLAYGMLRAMESYRTADYADQAQITQIGEKIMHSLNPAVNKFTAMKPLADTVKMKIDLVKSG